MPWAFSGASPRGRGKRPRSVRPGASAGLIPAWAGKTRSAPTSSAPTTAHPRVGGENPGSSGTPRHWSGSSPRGRGKLHVAAVVGLRVRLIPAWAGKTPSLPSSALPTRAHPRVGGENPTSPRHALMARGSSPRGRGKRHRHVCRRIQNRLIPAWAGKTNSRPRRYLRCAAHPRVGGENCLTGALNQTPTGSSPRGRGKRVPRLRVPQALRLIPAWAGKTTSISSVSQRRWAHPRVGGENQITERACHGDRGSSPRGRGKP